jgi:hypothetical protein
LIGSSPPLEYLLQENKNPLFELLNKTSIIVKSKSIEKHTLSSSAPPPFIKFVTIAIRGRFGKFQV